MLVLDANILVRAVLGSKVLLLLRQYADRVQFLAPDVAFEEAREHLPEILAKRQIPVPPATAMLDLIAHLVQPVEVETYSSFEAVARERIERRDADDWPVLASARALGCPIWTEDTDFFGCGVATWTTDRVRLYLAKSEKYESVFRYGLSSKCKAREGYRGRIRADSTCTCNQSNLSCRR